jgi:hypothetical protein
MRLDAVLASPALVWLATAEEKRAHLLSLTNIPENRLPRGTATSRTSATARLFPDRHKVADEERFAYAKEAFAGPRFQLLYARWLSHGDAVFDTLQSRAIGEAIARGAGRIETVVLPHQYRHLSPILEGVARVNGVSVHSENGPIGLGIPSVG